MAETITMKCSKLGKESKAIALMPHPGCQFPGVRQKGAWCCPECKEPLVPFHGDEGEQSPAPR